MVYLPGVEVPALSLVLLILIGIWDGVWKIIGLWHAGRNNQLVWFIFMAVLNTAGILPIIYLAFFQKKPAKVIVKKKR